MSEFNPYVEWLEIDPALCPPNYYDLLGLTPFENDTQKIEAAFEYRLRLVRSFQTGPRGLYTQDLLNELAQARLCLLNEQHREAYDDSLRGGQAKPPVSIDNLVGGDAPPVSANAIRITGSKDSEANLSPNTSRPAKRLSIVYVCICIVAVIAIWGVVKLSGGRNEKEANAAEKPQEEEVKKKPPPKKIINVVEDKKGILPGANNSFDLAPQNATVDQPHPTVIDTSDGQLFDQWQPVKSKVRWEIWINTPGHYEAIVSYNATTNEKFSRLRLQVDEQFPKSVKMRKAEELDEFFEEEVVILFRKKGAHIIEFSVEGDVGDFRLKSIILRPNRTKRD